MKPWWRRVTRLRVVYLRQQHEGDEQFVALGSGVVVPAGLHALADKAPWDVQPLWASHDDKAGCTKWSEPYQAVLIAGRTVRVIDRLDYEAAPFEEVARED